MWVQFYIQGGHVADGNRTWYCGYDVAFFVIDSCDKNLERISWEEKFMWHQTLNYLWKNRTFHCIAAMRRKVVSMFFELFDGFSGDQLGAR